MARITVGRYLDSATDSVETKELTGLVPKEFDYIDVGYDGSARISTVTYKQGGSGGTTVATLAITYVGATSRIATVTRT